MDIRKSRMWILLLIAAILLMLIYGMKSSCGENLKWNLRDGTLTITGSGRMNDYKGIFGDKGADGVRRMLCVDTPWEDKVIDKVIVEEGVTSIGNYAFERIRGSVSLPDTIETIGSHAFYNNYSLTQINLCDRLTEIGESAFAGCKRIEYIVSQAPEPPKLDESSFDQVDLDIPVRVPMATYEAYHQAVGWRQFSEITEY